MMNSQDAQHDLTLEQCTYRSLCMLDPIDYFYFRPGLSSLKCKKIADSKFRKKNSLKQRTKAQESCVNLIFLSEKLFFSKMFRTCTLATKVN